MILAGTKLKFPESILRAPGLRLIKAFLESPRLRSQLDVVLDSHRPDSAEAEIALLNQVLTPAVSPDTASPSATSRARLKLNRKGGQLKVTGSKGKVELSMDRDFGAVDASKLRAMLDQLGL